MCPQNNLISSTCPLPTQVLLVLPSESLLSSTCRGRRVQLVHLSLTDPLQQRICVPDTLPAAAQQQQQLAHGHVGGGDAGVRWLGGGLGGAAAGGLRELFDGVATTAATAPPPFPALPAPPSATTAATAPPPVHLLNTSVSSWLCVTTLDAADADSAELLVRLLELVRQGAEARRQAGSCFRALGF